MVIFTRKPLEAFSRLHPPATFPLNDWYSKTEAADWSDMSEMRQTFGSADLIGNDRFVFNIGGNKFRLIAMVHFGIRTVYVRGIFIHADYDKASKADLLNTL
ncbi:MAG: type II toxin-antitoxin system HigB family toxin [Chitinophagaceae bacterium]